MKTAVMKAMQQQQQQVQMQPLSQQQQHQFLQGLSCRM
jgi:hypothetical protein